MWCRVVAGTHAAVAFALGVYWIFASGEMSQIGDRKFAFLPINSHIAALGIGYFLYDFFAMLALAPYTNIGFLVGVLVHHLIFIVAYGSTLVRFIFGSNTGKFMRDTIPLPA